MQFNYLHVNASFENYFNAKRKSWYRKKNKTKPKQNLMSLSWLSQICRLQVKCSPQRNSWFIQHLKVRHLLGGGGLLEALLQTGSMTWDGCVKLAPWWNCDHLLFKQVALDSLGCFYLCSFNGLHELFYNQFCFFKFLKMVTIITSLFLASFAFCPPAHPPLAITF